jgi:hypothetical protein
VTLENEDEDNNRFPVLFDTREGKEGVIVDHPIFDQFPDGIPDQFQRDNFRVRLNELRDPNNYRDPMGKHKEGDRYSGRWLRSEIVPIAIEKEPCGLYLLVQQSYDELVDTPVQELRKGVIILSIAGLGLAVAFLVPLWALVLRMLK